MARPQRRLLTHLSKLTNHRKGEHMDKYKILVVEDDPDILETIRFSLEAEGYDVTTAVDGEDGLNRAKQIRPDLMILDVMMPKINGYRVSQMIKEEKPS